MRPPVLIKFVLVETALGDTNLPRFSKSNKIANK